MAFRVSTAIAGFRTVILPLIRFNGSITRLTVTIERLAKGMDTCGSGAVNPTNACGSIMGNRMSASTTTKPVSRHWRGSK